VAKKGRKGKSDQRVRAPSATPVTGVGEVAPPPSAPAAPLAAEPAASRTWSNALIVLFLAFHVVMPLRYYLGGGGYDERFSWRMFSTLRMHKCQVLVEETIGEDTRAVDLQKAVQIAWIGMLERYRRPVVDKLLARRCEQEHARSVRYERKCVDTDGSALPVERVSRDCGSGRSEASAGPRGSTP
jgi:hypothetical protein